MNYLADALPLMAWRPESQGVLLIAGADKTPPPHRQERIARNDWPRVPDPGIAAYDLAALFEMKLEKVGTLFVFAPLTVKHFLGAPKIAPENAPLTDKYQIAQALGESLTGDQWAAMASERGLGEGDLNPKQKSLYFGLLPDTVRLRATSGPGNQQAVELTPDERAQIRIHLDRRLSVSFATQESPNTSISFGDPSDQSQKFYMEYVPPAEGGDPLSRLVAPMVLNKPKPSQLGFASPALDAPVRLTDVKTVGELMQRVREATGLPSILSDARLSARSVRVWGESARSGDVLKALCRAFGGTFRKVGEGDGALYVLTDDLIGLGTRMASYNEWRELADRIRQEKTNPDKKTLESLDFTKIASLDDPYGLPVDLQNKIAYPPSGSRLEDRMFSIADLPASLKAYAEKGLAEHPTFNTFSNGAEQPMTLRKDKVRLTSSYRVRLMIPGWGETESGELGNLTGPIQNAEYQRADRELTQAPKTAAPLRFPLGWKYRAALVRPADPVACEAMAQKAAAAGFNALWVALPPGAGADSPVLAAAVAAGKKLGLAVVAQATLFQEKTISLPPGTRPDLTIQEETSDASAERMRRSLSKPGDKLPAATEEATLYLEPDALAQKIAIERAVAFAKMPGLAGLVLDGLEPPGYQPPPPAERPGYMVSYGNGSGELGYTPENRLAFLREKSLDPVDLLSGMSGLVPEPFRQSGPAYIRLADGRFGPDPAYRDPNRAWGEWRAARLDGFRKALFEGLKAAAPTFAVLVRPDGGRYSDDYYGLWERPAARPTALANRWESGNEIVRARGFSSYVLDRYEIYPFSEKNEARDRAEFREYLRSGAKTFGPGGQTWNGFVADVRTVPLEKMAAALGVFKEDPK